MLILRDIVCYIFYARNMTFTFCFMPLRRHVSERLLLYAFATRMPLHAYDVMPHAPCHRLPSYDVLMLEGATLSRH